MRSMSTGSGGGMFSTAQKALSDMFNIPRITQPDVYDQQERQAAETYRFLGKVLDPYYRKTPLKGYNLFANENEGWDELERRSRYFYNRWVAAP
jgi:hypothetical protein